MGTFVAHGLVEPKWNVNSFWHFEEWFLYFFLKYIIKIFLSFLYTFLQISFVNTTVPLKGNR